MSPTDMADNARRATTFLKTLANEHRLLILCRLAEGEKSVGELEALIGLRQPTLSQQLARLRADGVVQTRRQAKMIYYSLASAEARQVIELLYALFCAEAKPDAATAKRLVKLAYD
jgi:ArsR family transcriptional regulator